MSEASLEKKFAALVRSRGGYAIKYVPMGIIGFPDRIILMPGGRVGFAELKNPNGCGRVSKSQTRAVATLKRLGFQVIVSHSFEELTEWLDGLQAT